MEANQKKLYDHFMKTGQEDRAKVYLQRYPQFEVKKILKKKDK